MPSQTFSFETSDGALLMGERHEKSGAPPLVFSNSLGTTREMWADQVAALSSAFDIVLYDTRGHGKSRAHTGAYSLDRLTLDVVELLDFLQLDRVHFCGLSLGGMTGQLLAARAPERLNSLTLAATSAYMGPPAAWQQRIELVQSKGMKALEAAIREKWFAPKGNALNNAVDKAVKGLIETDPTGYAGCCAAIRDMDLRTLVPIITMPTLILAGQDDTATPPEHSTFLKEAILHASMSMLPGGHLINLEQPEAFTGALQTFLNNVK